jgi:peroxiredoxin
MIQPLFAATLSVLIHTGALPEPGEAASEPQQPPRTDQTTNPAAEPAAKLEQPLKVGDTFPSFTLRNEKGQPVSLADRLATGPVVITFYRGTWCPYCIKALDTIEESIPEINALGATVWAISPQTPEYAVDLREKTGVSYELLVDKDNKLADRLALMFTIDAATEQTYRTRYKLDVGKYNNSKSWQLPVPATYVVDKDSKVRYAWTDKDYTKRAPVSEVLAALKTITED